MSLDDSGLVRASRACRPRPFGLSLLFAAAVALSACGDAAGFRPLYGPTASGGNVSEHLKQVDLAPIPGRVGQRIRNEMIFQTTGGGNPLPMTHRLEIVLKENLTSTLVNVQGEAAGQVYSVRGGVPAGRHQGQEGGVPGHAATRAPASSGSSRSTPTCAPARTPRTAWREPSPTISRRDWPPIYPARRDLQALSSVLGPA